MRRIKELYFGMAAAENEVAADPARFHSTYFDKWDVVSKFAKHDKFLILGPKGAGKSAAARYVELEWRRLYGEYSVFSTFVDFDELNRTQTPLASLDRKIVGQVPALTDSAWRLFLAVRLLDSLLRDASCSLSKDAQVLKLVDNLRSAGLASDDFPQVLRRVRERRGGLNFPALGLLADSKSAETDSLSAGQVGDALIDLILSARTDNTHMLAIDGLDKAIGDQPAYWETLAALVRVTDGLTRTFRQSKSQHLHILVMCRSDVFRRVRFADAAKIAADGGVYMDWSAESDDPRDTQLWDYMARKASITEAELFSLLPKSVDVGKLSGTRRIQSDRYILQFTRYTPRDMTLLFNSFADQAAPQGSRVLSNTEVRRGVDHFASRHLLTEMMSEATGLLPDPVIDRFEQILSGLPSRVFTTEDLARAMGDAGVLDTISLPEFGEYLFLQGAIGNYRPRSNYVQFYHRRDAYKYQKSGPWLLHTGLIYAFNIPWNPPSEKPNKSRTPASRRSKKALQQGQGNAAHVAAAGDAESDKSHAPTAPTPASPRVRKRTRRERS